MNETASDSVIKFLMGKTDLEQGIMERKKRNDPWVVSYSV